MKSFLEQVTDEVLAAHGHELADVCMIFPTRRAGLYFKKALAAKQTSPVWSPAVYSLGDFAESLSPNRSGDSLDLVFSLYEVYRKYFPQESFEKFYPWGVMLLTDFEDTDSAMADGNRLFATVGDLKELDEAWQPDEEEQEKFREFWQLFFQRDPGPIRKSFMDSWKHLQNIYSEFRAGLLEKKSVYPGLVMRTVAEGLRDGSLSSSYRHHVFAGFYALSRAEESVIRYFLDKKTGRIFFDADTYYTDDKRQEAGLFIRRNRLTGNEISWKQDLLGTQEKTIECIGVPLQVLQAKAAGQILAGMNLENAAPDQTAVVLPDEQLLLPVLYALPDKISDINVTMGYPLRQSPMYNLIESVFELQKTLKSGSFYFKQIVSILSHPYIRILHAEEVTDWLAAFRKDPRIRILQKGLTEQSAFFHIVFSAFNNTDEALDYFEKLFLLLIDGVRRNREALHAMEKEYIYYYYTRFKKLDEIIRKQTGKIAVDTFRQLFKEVIHSTRIPFTGEPLKGLQVMGLLETRVLDFENVIILSLNEDVLPPSSHHPSYIPFNIRKAFGLPTYEDKNAVAAYHFYRLLQRAQNIYLIYNTEVKNFSGGEKSRFLLQIENELLKKNPKIKFRERQVSVTLNEHVVQPLIVHKTDAVMKELSSYFEPLKQPVQYSKKFSPSGLSTYIACPLRFYFQYVAKLKEPDDLEEFIEGGLLGTILHAAMHALYKPLQVITAGDFEKLLPLAERAVDEAIKSNFAAAGDLEGKNLLLRNVLIELVKKIIRFDLQSAPLQIRYLEQDFVMPVELDGDRKVHLYGIIDRVDSQSGSLRIVDYKTGQPDMKVAKDVATLFASPEYKEQFQTFFYSFLLRSKESMPVKAGLFRLKEASKGIFYINGGEPISQDQFAEFGVEVKKLLGEIFDPAKPFAQTDDEKRCLYCAFKDICNR